MHEIRGKVDFCVLKVNGMSDAPVLYAVFGKCVSRKNRLKEHRFFLKSSVPVSSQMQEGEKDQSMK